MPKPTLQQIFGATSSVASNSLTINFADFAALGWNDAAGTTDPEKWLAAIIKHARSFYAANTDDLPAIAIDDPFLGLTTRNSVAKREYSYSVRIYEADSGATTPDPDNL